MMEEVAVERGLNDGLCITGNTIFFFFFFRGLRTSIIKVIGNGVSFQRPGSETRNARSFGHLALTSTIGVESEIDILF